MARKKMKLFVWEGVLTGYTSGMMVAIAPTVEEARKQLKKRCDYLLAEDLHKEPDVYDVTEPVAFHVWGGG